MFRILGEDALYIDIPVTFKKRMLELASAEDEKESYLREVLEGSEVTYMLNGTTEEHTFFIHLDKGIDPEHVQILADAVLAVLTRTVEEVPAVAVDDIRQKYQVIITNYEEPEIIGIRKTPGMSSGEVFKPIIRGLDQPGRANSSMQDQFF